MVEGRRLHTGYTHTLTQWRSVRGGRGGVRSYNQIDIMTVFIVKTRVCIAREAQLVEQSIEAALVVSSSLISSKISVISIWPKDYFIIIFIIFFLFVKIIAALTS